MNKHFFTRLSSYITALFFSFAVISTANAQMSGNYTVCASGCNYSTIGNAVSALQSNGVNGATTISIAAGTYAENLTISGISGLSSTNTLTFKGTGSSPADVEITSNNNYYNNYTVHVSYLSNVHFENIWVNNSNNNYYYYNSGFYLDNVTDASIKNCHITQDYTNYYYYYGGYGVQAYYCDNLAIENNKIRGGYYGLYFNYNRNVKVKGNNLKKHMYYGIYGYMNTGNEYLSNDIDSATYNNYGIITDHDHNSKIENNVVNNATYGCLVQSPRGNCTVINNMLNIAQNWGIGLYIYNYNYYYYYNNYYGSPTINDTANLKAYHNTVNNSNSSNSNPLVYIYNDNYYYYYNNNNQVVNVDLRNNNFTSANSKLYGYYNYNYYNNTNNTIINVTSEGNNYYSPNGFLAEIYTQNNYNSYSSLSSFKTAMGSSTDQSVSVSYVSATDLHYASGSNVPTGANVGVNYDIDGDARGTTIVAAGADEAASDQPPVAVAKNITIYLDANGEATISASDVDGGSSDDNAISSSSVSKSSFNCSNTGDNSVILTVTDASNQSDTATAIVTVIDNIAPTAKTKNVTVTLNLSGSATVSASDINNGSTDNCTIASYSLSKTDFDCSNVGNNTVTLTVADASGNSSTETATVTVETTLTADAGADQQVYYGYTPLASATLTGNGANGGGTYTYEWSTGSTSQSITVSPSTTTTYTLTVTDNNGCTATDKVTVNVEDVRCGNNNNKVIVCHKGSEICVASSGVQAHLDHGCMVGTCKSGKKNGTEPFEIEEDEDIHADVNHTVLNAYPNPFKNTSTVEFTVAKDQQISLALYDVQGRKVQDIFNGNANGNILYRYKIDAKGLPSDVYFVRLVADDKVQNIRLVLTK